MNRREFIKQGAAAASLLLGGSMLATGCARDLRDQLVQLPEPTAGSRALDPEGYQILFYASLAPSGHNSQPWTVKVEGPDQWVVGVDSDRCLPRVDPDNREVMLSLGAFAENLVQAAATLGKKAQIQVMGTSPHDRDMFRVTLSSQSVQKSDVKALVSRRTVKNGLASREIKPADVNTFGSAVGEGFYYFPAPSSHARFMAEAAVENFRRQCDNDAAMAELAAWTRLSDKHARSHRDGLTTDGMEITGLSGWMVRHLMDVSDVTKETWRKKAIEKTAAQAFEGGGWMVITSPDDSVPSLIDAGRRFQRMALLARSRGIGIHPMTQTLEEAHGKQQIRENHDAGMIPQFMLRVGYVHPYPEPVSLRRPVDWFLV
ncbi:MAG: hypothetical protein K9L23_19780 [Desulfotignum sp.]|nr:hypothetical protein [Desulfotignum sp.]MCF8090289.1 hypothetical protein [Desulfotignum sp.]